MDFNPKLNILPLSQQILWPELKDVPSEFTLYGGTAIALHLGHRQSVDFDFFAATEINPARLQSEISFLQRSMTTQQEKNTLTCLIDRDGPIMVSFFGLPNINIVSPPLVCPDNQLKVASLVDLAGMKAAVVQQRAEAKDYVDLAAIILSGIDLPTALSAARSIYGPSFNPQITLKALSYFDDGDLRQLSSVVKQQLTAAVLNTDLSNLP